MFVPKREITSSSITEKAHKYLDLSKHKPVQGLQSMFEFYSRARSELQILQLSNFFYMRGDYFHQHYFSSEKEKKIGSLHLHPSEGCPLYCSVHVYSDTITDKAKANPSLKLTQPRLLDF